MQYLAGTMSVLRLLLLMLIAGLTSRWSCMRWRLFSLSLLDDVTTDDDNDDDDVDAAETDVSL